MRLQTAWNPTLHLCLCLYWRVECRALHLLMCAREWKTDRGSTSVKYRGRKCSQERVDTYGLMDGWKGNNKFGAAGSVSASVDLIWAGLGDRELAEELGGPPPPPVEVTMVHTHGQAHIRTHTQTQTSNLVSYSKNYLPFNSCQPSNCQQWNSGWHNGDANP